VLVTVDGQRAVSRVGQQGCGECPHGRLRRQHVHCQRPLSSSSRKLRWQSPRKYLVELSFPELSISAVPRYGCLVLQSLSLTASIPRTVY